MAAVLLPAIEDIEYTTALPSSKSPVGRTVLKVRPLSLRLHHRPHCTARLHGTPHRTARARRNGPPDRGPSDTLRSHPAKRAAVAASCQQGRASCGERRPPPPPALALSRALCAGEKRTTAARECSTTVLHVIACVPQSDVGRYTTGMWTKRYLHDQLQLALAGRAAEELTYGREELSSLHQHRIILARQIATKILNAGARPPGSRFRARRPGARLARAPHRTSERGAAWGGAIVAVCRGRGAPKPALPHACGLLGHVRWCLWFVRSRRASISLARAGMSEHRTWAALSLCRRAVWWHSESVQA